VPWTIYCHTLTADGRKYVGQTSKTMQERWNGHCRAAMLRGSRFYFANAIRHYGPRAFVHEVLQVCETQEEANAAEDEWIEKLGTRDMARGFNRKAGGKQGPHFITKNPWHRPEHREKVVAAINRPEARAKMSVASRAFYASPEAREKSRARFTAQWTDPERRARLLAAREGKSKERFEKDPTLRQRMQAARKKTMATRREARTHFECSVHGQILLTDCYSKVSKRDGLRTYECKKCVLAAQKAKREAFRAANSIQPRTSFKCRVHGEIPFEQCFERKSPTGAVWHKCKACSRAQQKAWHDAKKASKLPSKP
jgi:GIY-YIG catalytic domain